MQINLFNGGLSTRLLPHLIQANEAVKCENVDTSRGSLVPLKGLQDLNREVASNIYKFNGIWIDTDENRDYVEYQEKLFYSNGVGRPQWSPDGARFFNVGIAAPETSPRLGASSVLSLTEWAIVKKPKFFTCEKLVFRDNESTSYPLPEGEYFMYGAVKHDRLNVYALEKLAEKERFGSRVLPCIYFGGADAASYDGKAQIYISKESLDKCQAITSYYDPFFTPHLIVGNGRTGFGKVIDIADFAALGKTSYLALWTDESSKAKSLELFEVDFSSEAANNHIYGIEITKKLGYTLELFRNGFKVPITEEGDKYYDNKRTVQISDTEVLEGIKTTSYVYTYYSFDTGQESAPSPASSLPELGNTSFISVEVKASSDPQVDKIRVYRIGGNLGQYTLVTEIDNQDATYLDSKAEANLSATSLPTSTYNPAPTGLRYLTSSNAMLFGAVDDKLYFSKVGDPFFWDGFNFIDFENHITGVGATPNGLLVFTKDKTFIVTGNSPSTLSKYLLSPAIGCVLHKSIQTMANTLVWLSKDGLYASSGGSLQALSREKLGDFDFKNPICSEVKGEMYFLSYQFGTLIMDLRFGLAFSTLKERFKGLHVSESEVFGCSDSNRLVKLFKDDSLLEIDYLSPAYSDGSTSTAKVYTEVNVYAQGSLALTIFVDGKQVSTTSLVEGYNSVKLPQGSTRGYFIQFGLKGVGSLLELEYKVEGRQNG